MEACPTCEELKQKLAAANERIKQWKELAQIAQDESLRLRKELDAANERATQAEAVITEKDEALERVARACREELTLPYYQVTNPPAVSGTFVALRTISEAALALQPSSDALAEYMKPALDALIKLRDCDFVITSRDRMDAVRDIARAALAQYPEAK